MGWDATEEASEDAEEDTVETSPEAAPLWASESIEKRRRNRRRVLRTIRIGLVTLGVILVLPYAPGPLGEHGQRIRSRLGKALQTVTTQLRREDELDGSPSRDKTQPRNGRATSSASHLDIPVEIRGGTLVLGSDGDGLPVPSPEPILIPSFEIMAREVTVAQLDTFCSTEASPPTACQTWGGKQDWQTPDHPAVTVPWKLAVAFCQDWQGRLPTEAEW
ncbi:MAG TPA: hypothetical protein DIU15_05715, partial [Deltaproteobacteria bacterium]|nr:hypothetical protein [Deltaproteobacteria bacterium]